MYRTATEVKQNFGNYLLTAGSEDVFITKNGKVIAVLTSPDKAKVEAISSLRGILPSDVDIDVKKMKDEYMRDRYADYY